MGIKGKTFLKIGTAIGSVIAAGAGLLLAKKTGELSEEKDMTKLEPLGNDEFDDDDEEIIEMPPEDVEKNEEEEDEDDE